MDSELDRLKGAFLAIISHELRTPLTEIITALSLLQESFVGPLNARQRQYLEIAQDAAQQLNTLISDLIAFSQLQSDMVGTRREPTQLGELVSDVAAQHHIRASGRGLILSVTTEPGLGLIPVDRALITRVIANLIVNAINFTPRGGQVSVQVASEEGGQCIVVTDTGVGIPREKQARLFESFYQADDHLTRRVGGLGIGLAYARHIVEAHRGRITFTSDEGLGSTFVVHLPAA